MSKEDDSVSIPDSNPARAPSPALGSESDYSRVNSSEFGSERDEHDSAIQTELRTISFGVLAEAQESFSHEKRFEQRSQVAPSTIDSEKLQILRERLAELKKLRARKSDHGAISVGEGEEVSTKDREHQRASKHAPMEQSSKHAVTRKRPAIEISQNPFHARDPRFSSLSGSTDQDKIRNNYAFLDLYRESELSELRAALTKTRNPAEKEALKREIMAMENRSRAQKEKDREREVRQEHRRKEKELVRQGKKPYFLKQGEVKKQALVKKYEGLKGKEREKVMQRKRKKEGEKAKKAMPFDRRRDRYSDL